MKSEKLIKERVDTIIFFFVFINSFNINAQETIQDSIDLFIQNQMERFHIPGISACVIKGEKVVWSKGYGYSNIESKRKMTPESIMNIASVSKTITATAIMQLWEKDELELDTDINEYLDFTVRNPNFPQLSITIRQLLTHSSSIADGSSLKIGFECGEPSKNLKDWIYNYFDINGEYYDPIENFHKFAPGAGREYSNVGFGLLGLIVESISKKPFNHYVKENIFRSLKMNDSGYFLKNLDTSKVVTPYLYLGPLQKNLTKSVDKVLPYFNPYCLYSFWNYPDGLVRTSINDISKFAIAYMNGGMFQGQRILRQETIDLMMSSQLSESINEDKDQGLGWFQSSSLFPTWYHGGSDPGVSTRMYVNTKDKITVIVFQNANEDNTYYIIRELYDKFK